MVTANQCKAARAMVGWSQSDLAKAAGVNMRTVQDFESGQRDPMSSTLRKLEQALEAAGVQFIARNGGGPGVRWKDPEADR